MSRPGRISAPPARLEPLFAWIERRDRARYRIQPLDDDSVIGWGWLRHHGSATTLRDGTVIQPGDRIIGPHGMNDSLAGRTADGWQAELFARGMRDLRVLAGIVAAMPPEERPAALWGATLLWPFAKRAGWEVHDRPQTFRVRLEDWYMRGVIRRWSKAGGRRLDLGRGELRTRDCWLSTGDLLARFGPDATPGPGER